MSAGNSLTTAFAYWYAIEVEIVPFQRDSQAASTPVLRRLPKFCLWRVINEGFIVLPYFTDDLIMAKKLLDAGCPAVMPLAAPIGSGMGVQNPANLRIMREQLPDATIIVDAGVGTASDAAIAMELGADGVLMNTAIAEAEDAAQMATAMKLAIQAGRLAYTAGRMPKRLYASASSPLQGVIK